jgi:aspartate ammonia-lyase
MAAAAANSLMVVPLGGTAIGTGLGAVPGYREAVVRRLAEVTGWAISGPCDLFDGMQNADAFARISSDLRTAADILGKIASDLVILSSGPTGGIGEIVLPAVQAGSSIMPGKINPVLPMMMQQVAFAVTGNDLAISMAVLQGQLEINHFEPVTASRLFDSLDLLTNGTRLFAERCIDGLAADRDTSVRNLMESSALATVAFIIRLERFPLRKIFQASAHRFAPAGLEDNDFPFISRRRRYRAQSGPRSARPRRRPPGTPRALSDRGRNGPGGEKRS